MAKIHSKEYQEFLRRLKEARLKAGLSQYDVADLLKVKQQYVSKCELGERRMDLVDLAKFADIYRKPLEYFRPPTSSPKNRRK